MIERVTVRQLAKQDIREARSWYRKISPRLAEDFLNSLDDAIALAKERPHTYPLVYRMFRRLLLHRFPYALFYFAEKERIVIVAVLHQARDPEILGER